MPNLHELLALSKTTTHQTVLVRIAGTTKVTSLVCEPSDNVHDVLIRVLQSLYGNDMTNPYIDCDDPTKDVAYYFRRKPQLDLARSLMDNEISHMSELQLFCKHTFQYGMCDGCLAGALNFLNVSEEHSHSDETVSAEVAATNMLFVRSLLNSQAEITKAAREVLLRVLLMMIRPKSGRSLIYDHYDFLAGLSIAVFSLIDTHRHQFVTRHSSSFVIKLHQERCPICFERFEANASSLRCPYRVCSSSDKHSVCRSCVEGLHACPLCRSATQVPAPCTTHINRIKTLLIDLKTACQYTEFPGPVNVSALPVIGCGAFCDVYKYDHKGSSYALKVPRVSLSDLNSSIESSILHEIAVALPFSHIKYFVRVFGVVNAMQRGTSILMEYISGPNLAQAISNGTLSRMTSTQRNKICLDIARGVIELHAAGVIHRDLKPENIMLDLTVNAHITAKLTDFGISTLIQTASGTLGRERGTVGYSAPEACDPPPGYRPKKASDVYSMSLILYEVLCCKRIFEGMTSTQVIMQFVIRGQRPRWPADVKVSSALKALIALGWSADIEQRPLVMEFVFSLNPEGGFENIFDDHDQIPALPARIDENALLEALKEGYASRYAACVGKRFLAGDVEFASLWARGISEYAAETERVL